MGSDEGRLKLEFEQSGYRVDRMDVMRGDMRHFQAGDFSAEKCAPGEEIPATPVRQGSSIPHADSARIGSRGTNYAYRSIGVQARGVASRQMKSRARRRGADENSHRLEEILDVERRLEELVQAAARDAARRVAAAQAAREERLAVARTTAAQMAAEHESAERAAHERAVAAVAAAADATVRHLTLAEERVDELARWVLSEAIRGTGDSP